jgi:mRNA interferase YafQ
LKQKPAPRKRAPFPRRADYAKTFVKDWERLSRAGRYDLSRLKTAMMLLIANDAALGPEWSDHALKGGWSGHRECHAGGDFLLIYKIDDSTGAGGTIVFIRAGTHSELFRE